MKQNPVTEAIRLYKEDQPDQSRDLLRQILKEQPCQLDALLWLARVSSAPREAMAAAELAYSLDPENEVAQRAIAAVRERFPKYDAQRDPLEVVRLTGLTQSQARAVNWPFKGLNSPIGVLIDEEKIKLSDVAWAAENAFDPYIQQAARTLILGKLLPDKLKEPTKPMDYLKGSNYIAWNERFVSFKIGILFGLMIVMGVFSLALGFASSFLHWIPVLNSNLISFFLIPFLVWIGWLLFRWLDNLDAYRLGREGEQKVVDHFRASLRSPWLLVQNMIWPNRKWGDIDIILAGVSGLWVFEVKAYTKPVRNIGDTWQYKSRFGWRKMSAHPGRQARRNAVRVKDYLDLHGVKTGFVQAVVVWAGDDEKLTLEDPAVPVWKLSDLETHLEDLWTRRRLKDESGIDQIKTILASAIEKAKK